MLAKDEKGGNALQFVYRRRTDIAAALSLGKSLEEAEEDILEEGLTGRMAYTIEVLTNEGIRLGRFYTLCVDCDAAEAAGIAPAENCMQVTTRWKKAAVKDGPRAGRKDIEFTKCCVNQVLRDDDPDLDPNAKAGLGAYINKMTSDDAKKSDRYCRYQECRARKPTKRCGRGCGAAYCSKECQVADWPEHKKICVVPAEKKKDSA